MPMIDTLDEVFEHMTECEELDGTHRTISGKHVTSDVKNILEVVGNEFHLNVNAIALCPTGNIIQQ